MEPFVVLGARTFSNYFKGCCIFNVVSVTKAACQGREYQIAVTLFGAADRIMPDTHTVLTSQSFTTGIGTGTVLLVADMPQSPAAGCARLGAG